jgi:hypothetical protein
MGRGGRKLALCLTVTLLAAWVLYRLLTSCAVWDDHKPIMMPRNVSASLPYEYNSSAAFFFPYFNSAVPIQELLVGLRICQGISLHSVFCLWFISHRCR